MNKKQKTLTALRHYKLLPLYYHESADVSVKILRALYDGGIRMVEYTNRGEAALENFEALRKAANALPDLELGIGTIKSKKNAKKFIEAGADFIVCPTVNIEVGEYTMNEKLAWIPGCMTPTEIATAEEAGATFIKLFPGNVLGPGYVSAIKELFTGIDFMPTGGVDVDAKNLAGWFGAGAAGVGMGSKLITKELVAKGDYEGIKKAAVKALQLVKEAAMQVAE